MAFEFTYDHSLQPEPARARLTALGEYLSNKYGLSVTWNNDDEATITGSYLVVSINGRLTLTPGQVRFSGKDPGMLWRSKAKDYLQRKLAQYLDPASDVATLPRR